MWLWKFEVGFGALFLTQQLHTRLVTLASPVHSMRSLVELVQVHAGCAHEVLCRAGLHAVRVYFDLLCVAACAACRHSRSVTATCVPWGSSRRRLMTLQVGLTTKVLLKCLQRCHSSRLLLAA